MIYIHWHHPWLATGRHRSSTSQTNADIAVNITIYAARQPQKARTRRYSEQKCTNTETAMLMLAMASWQM
jgi:hypothetical protein